MDPGESTERPLDLSDPRHLEWLKTINQIYEVRATYTQEDQDPDAAEVANMVTIEASFDYLSYPITLHFKESQVELVFTT